MIDIVGTIWWMIYSVIFAIVFGILYGILSVVISAICNKFHIKFTPRHIYRDETGIHWFKWAEMIDIPEWLNAAAKERMTDLETTSHILIGQDRAYMISVAQDHKSYKVYQQG